MKKKQWFVEICELEEVIRVFRDENSLCEFLKNNDPITVGTVRLNKKDLVMARKVFKQHPGATVVVLRWNKYIRQLGLGKV